MTTKTKFVLGVMLASVLVIIAACGGGGGSDPAPPPPDTRVPVVTSAKAVNPAGVTVNLFTSGAVDVPRDAILLVTVDEVVQGCPTTTPVVGTFGTVEGALTCVKDGATSVVTLTPTVPFPAGFQASLVYNPKDVAGNQGTFRTSFTVVVPPATVALTATPTTVVAGSSTTIAWTTTNAVNCLASGSWNGSLAPAGGSQTVTPTQTTTYGIECWNSANVTTGVVNVTVTVTPAPVKLEYKDVVIATRPSQLNNIYGVDRSVPGAFVPIKNLIGRPFYSVGIRLPRADNCLVEVRALDNTTFVRYNMLLNPLTLEMTMDTTGNQTGLDFIRDYIIFNPADPLTHPLWETSAKTPAGWYYTLKLDTINLYFVDNEGVVTKLTNTTFEASGVIRALWSFTCKAQ